MMKERAEKILVMILLGVVLTSCGGNSVTKEHKITEVGKEETDELSESLEIENKCEHLLKEKANAISEKIKEISADTWEQSGNVLENYRFQFTNETIKEGKYYIEGTVIYDWTNERAPEENTVIIGMREVQRGLKTEEEKAKAEEIIDDFLVEFDANYHVTEEIPAFFIVMFENPKDLNFELYYLEKIGEEEKLYPLEQYYEENYKENYEQKIQLGKDTLEERMNYE